MEISIVFEDLPILFEKKSLKTNSNFKKKIKLKISSSQILTFGLINLGVVLLLLNIKVFGIVVILIAAVFHILFKNISSTFNLDFEFGKEDCLEKLIESDLYGNH